MTRTASARLRLALRRAVLGAGLWCALHVLYVVGDGFRDVDRGRGGLLADVAVILGTTVKPDGVPTPRLAARLDRGVELYRAGRVRALIASGGLGEEGQEEADAMARYLVDAGVPARDVIIDRDGPDTWHTAASTARLLRARHFSTAIAVSQWFHLTRTKLALRRHGVETVGSAHARHYDLRDGYSVLREVVGFYYYALRPLP